MSLKSELSGIDQNDARQKFNIFVSKLQSIFSNGGKEAVNNELSSLKDEYGSLSVLINEVMTSEIIPDLSDENKLYMGLGASLALHALVEIAELDEMPKID